MDNRKIIVLNGRNTIGVLERLLKRRLLKNKLLQIR